MCGSCTALMQFLFIQTSNLFLFLQRVFFFLAGVSAQGTDWEMLKYDSCRYGFVKLDIMGYFKMCRKPELSSCLAVTHRIHGYYEGTVTIMEMTFYLSLWL